MLKNLPTDAVPRVFEIPSVEEIQDFVNLIVSTLEVCLKFIFI